MLITKPKNKNMKQQIDIQSYDKVIIAFSGGKDSMACFLHILELGVPKEKIELWHHCIDGKEGSKLMDWPVTEDYCRKIAEAFQVPFYLSWKQGGFEREMLRNNSKTAPTMFEDENHNIQQVGGTAGKEGTRMKFPQVSPDLSVRWCSAYLKIDVCATAIRNQERFNDKKTLLVTGERGEESKARSNYAIFEPDRADNRDGSRVVRTVDHYRPIRDWREGRVWRIMKKFKVRTHPAYYLGWGRVSCAACIFGSKNQFASLAKINPEQVEKIAQYEENFGVTIKRKESVRELVAKGTPYASMEPEDIKDALTEEFHKPIFMEKWILPAGAFGESCGPL
jgi:3'-phosphoadenosine 5'-phosphosulfate sulfotransferase (PAPS reductase)/FAD synthetase